jgi:hypothetical protein
MSRLTNNAARLRMKLGPAQWIMLLAVLQVFNATYFLKIEGFENINSILFLGSGVLIAALILKIPAVHFSGKQWRHKGTIGKGLIILALLPVSYHVSRKIMDGTPLGIQYADMLPIMKVMVTRFLNGQWAHVYDPIPEIWGGIQPIYLPAMWMPYIYSTVLDFDMRWITVSAIWASIILCIWPGRWRRYGLYALFAIGLLFLLSWFHFEETNNVIRLTEEGVVYLFYVCMAIALILRNPYLVGICAALCFLSRYSIIGWLPFSLLYLLYKKDYSFLAKYAASGLATALLLLLPFGLRPLTVHWIQPDLYIQHAERVWRENPEYFRRSLGVAKFFGPGAVRANHAVLQYGSFLVPILFFFLVRKRGRTPMHLVLLSGFQLALTFFYNFIDVSYLYLYYTPVFVSLAIAAWLNAGTDAIPIREGAETEIEAA